jgi:hypothetical protein
VVIFDRLVARQPETYQYWLHAVNPFEIEDRNRVILQAGDVVCPIQFLAPAELQLTQTNQYDPNPRERIKLREWHLSASTAKSSRTIEFVTVMRPHRASQQVPEQADLQKIDGGYVLTAELSSGSVTALLPTDDTATLDAAGLETKGRIIIQRRDANGREVETVTVKPSRDVTKAR